MFGGALEGVGDTDGYSKLKDIAIVFVFDFKADGKVAMSIDKDALKNTFDGIKDEFNTDALNEDAFISSMGFENTEEKYELKDGKLLIDGDPIKYNFESDVKLVLTVDEADKAEGMGFLFPLTLEKK